MDDKGVHNTLHSTLAPVMKAKQLYLYCLTLQAPRVTNVNFLLTKSIRNQKKRFVRINKMINEGKML